MADLDTLEFSLTEDQKAIRDVARDFAESEIKPHRLEWDETQHFPMETFRKMGQLGFLGALMPTELGGAGLGAMEATLIIEQIARVDPAVALSVAAHNGLCSSHIYRFASDELRKIGRAHV